MPVNKGNIFMLFLMLFNIILMIAFTCIYYFFPDSTFLLSPLFLVVNEILGFLLPLTVFLVITRQPVTDILPRRSLGYVNILLLIAISLCLQPLMMLLSALTTLIFPNPAAEMMTALQPYPVWGALLIIAVTPAICEEVVFRGYILSQHSGVRIKQAVFVNGLFFAVMHLDAQQFLYAFFMGVIFAYFVYYTRSIFASILAHGCANGIQLLLSFWLTDSSPLPTEAEPVSGDLLYAVYFLLVVSLAILPVLIILFRTFIAHNRRRNPVVDAPVIQKKDKLFGLSFWGVIVIYMVFMLLQHVA